MTDGSEVLAEASTFPPTAAATESWPPNISCDPLRVHQRYEFYCENLKMHVKEPDAELAALVAGASVCCGAADCVEIEETCR